jgi:hypothetical protein
MSGIFAKDYIKYFFAMSSKVTWRIFDALPA